MAEIVRLWREPVYRSGAVKVDYKPDEPLCYEEPLYIEYRYENVMMNRCPARQLVVRESWSGKEKIIAGPYYVRG